MEAVVAAWLASMLIGAVGWPFAFALARRFPDAGAGLCFPLGLLAVSLPYYLLRVVGLLPPGRGGYLVAVLIAGVGALAVSGRTRRRALDRRRIATGIALATSVFTGSFLLYAAFRSYNPEIAGTEQPMDLLFLNATLASPGYPPYDPWLAGEPISYYYFGYVQVGVLSAIAGVPSAVGYNLGLAWTFAATAASLVSVSGGLARWALGSRRRRFVSVAPAVTLTLVLFVGSLSAVFEWAAAHERYNPPLFRAFGVEHLLPCEEGAVGPGCYAATASPRTSAWYPTEYWFWWRGSRVIPGTITEFPFFSFLLGDLHPHVMALPLVVMAVGVAAATWRGRGPLRLATVRTRPWETAAVAAIIGALAFQNAWDVITFTGLFLLAAAARNWRTEPAPRALLAALGWLLPALPLALALYAPWWLTFSSQASGILPYVGEGTRPAHAFLQFGVPAALALLLVFAVRFPSWSSASAVVAGWVAVLPFIAWVVFAAARGELADAADSRGSGAWATLALYAAGCFALTATALHLGVARRAAAPAAALGAAGLLLLYGAELFFVRDVFAGSVPRLNTVFKLSYQAWVLLGLAGGTGVALAAAAAFARLATPQPQRIGALAARGALAAVVLLLACGLVYPLLAAFNRTEGFTRATGLDGLAWVRQADPAEAAITAWIAANTEPGAVVIEATGRRWVLDAAGSPILRDAGVDYTEAGRIASRTGRQAPIGWYFHQVQWRGDTESNRARFTARQAAVDEAYLATDPARVIEVMRQFGAEYLVVGRVELAAYPGLPLDFSEFLDVVFEDGRYRVYRLPYYRPVSQP